MQDGVRQLEDSSVLREQTNLFCPRGALSVHAKVNQINGLLSVLVLKALESFSKLGRCHIVFVGGRDGAPAEVTFPSSASITSSRLKPSWWVLNIGDELLPPRLGFKRRLFDLLLCIFMIKSNVHASDAFCGLKMQNTLVFSFSFLPSKQD